MTSDSLRPGLEMFVIESRSRRLSDRYVYLLDPRRGVMALAQENHFLRTAVGGELAEEALSYVELGLTSTTSNIPGLAKYEEDPGARFSASRLAASLKLANQRLWEQHEEAASATATSVTCLMVEGGRLTLLVAGIDSTAWRISEGRLEWLAQPSASEIPRSSDLWLGRSKQLEPNILEVQLAVGDLVGLGWIGDEEIEILCEHSDTLDRALAACLALDGPRFPGLRFLIARWSGRGRGL